MKIIALLGVSGVGKSKVAIALAKLLDCDIINFDLYQMYQQFNIGVGKLQKTEMEGVTHHFMDFLAPDQQYSIQQFQSDCRDLLKEKQLIIMTGGSNLYLNAVLYQYLFQTETEKDDLFIELSTEQIYQKLLNCDPTSAQMIDRKNRRRLVRALNYYLKNNSSIPKNTFDKNKPLYDVQFIKLAASRAEVIANVEKRFKQMLDEGFVAEVQQLKNQYPTTIQPFRAIGYQELADYLDNKITYQEAIMKTIIRLRQYTRRQLTWLNNQYVNATSFNNDNPVTCAEQIYQHLKVLKWI